MTAPLALIPLLLACGEKKPVDSAVDQATDHRSTMPAPLEPRSFQLPTPSTGQLSNGIPVVVVENHEVPLVYVRLVLKAGSWTDPADRPGLASVTMDMLNEGAAGMSAAELSGAARKLGSSIGSDAGLDGSTVSASGLKSKLEPTLDLMAKVALQPDFPQDDWSLMQKQRLQGLAQARQDPRQMASRAWARLGYGAKYAGQLTTEASYQAINTDQMQAWYDDYVVPANAMLVVGGDTTLDEIQPLLEERFGSWQADGTELPALPSADQLPQVKQTRVYLVDKPGAAQSVVRVGSFVGARTDPDYDAFELANMAIGGMFTARINMNLREDKGWTYGAWSWSEPTFLPARWQVGTSVVTPATADAVSEIMRELTDSLGDRPVTADELDSGRGYRLGTWPLQFENPGTLMSETVAIWRYGLPDDWITGAPDRLRAVTLEGAQQAWSSRIDLGRLDILVVGDAATVKEPLEALGYPVLMMDADGKVLQD